MARFSRARLLGVSIVLAAGAGCGSAGSVGFDDEAAKGDPTRDGGRHGDATIPTGDQAVLADGQTSGPAPEPTYGTSDDAASDDDATPPVWQPDAAPNPPPDAGPTPKPDAGPPPTPDAAPDVLVPDAAPPPPCSGKPEGYNWDTRDVYARCCGGAAIRAVTNDNCGVCGIKCNTSNSESCTALGSGYYCRGCVASLKCWSGCCSMTFSPYTCSASDCKGNCDSTHCPAGTHCVAGDATRSNYCSY